MGKLIVLNPEHHPSTVAAMNADPKILAVVKQLEELAFNKGRATVLDEMQGFIEMSAGGQHG